MHRLREVSHLHCKLGVSEGAIGEAYGLHHTAPEELIQRGEAIGHEPSTWSMSPDTDDSACFGQTGGVGMIPGAHN